MMGMGAPGGGMGMPGMGAPGGLGAAGGMGAPGGMGVAGGMAPGGVGAAPVTVRGWNPSAAGQREQQQEVKQMLTYGERRSIQAISGVAAIIVLLVLVIYFMFIREDPIMRECCRGVLVNFMP